MLKFTPGRKSKQFTLTLIILAMLSTLVWSLQGWANFSMQNSFGSTEADAKAVREGPLSKVVLIAGPFDIHRHYRSMEGPWINLDFKPGEALNQGNIICPEGMVN